MKSDVHKDWYPPAWRREGFDADRARWFTELFFPLCFANEGPWQ